MKGGYQPMSRLATLLDEIVMETVAAEREPSAERMRRAFPEIRDLVSDAKRFMSYCDMQPSMGAGA